MESETEMSWFEQGDERQLVQQFLATGGAPAFMQRAVRVHEVLENLMHGCRVQREEWLTMVRLRLGTLFALAGTWDRLRNRLSRQEVENLHKLHDDLKPKLRRTLEPTLSEKTLVRALEELKDCLERFNKRWLEHLQRQDFTLINQEREKYNSFYLLEKECIIGSPLLARRGFTPLKPIRWEDVLQQLPTLPVFEIEK